ncbi:esterase-like activity of phytase family protein [Sphingomonas jatrophae]|uniref:Phytase-like domain-containing protein n=1 Tax=Sphingomonas jatrophae TaxID=1166337 RepID=A0A1I6LPW5_9SPHN|nr:esterase-like activity of phytase family protein [Sphingomonas jatrophae]SFS05516.1 hypothetical protein SAMN05192580_3106 [Sphingomonas jatrophae]
MRFSLIRLAALLPLAACATPTSTSAPTVEPEAVLVEAQPVPLDPADPTREQVGALRWRGGLVLTSADKRFGGLSGMRWDAGRLVLVSDEGDAWSIQPREAHGRLIGVGDARVRRLNGADGRPLPRIKELSDAESIELVSDPACRGTCPATHAIVSLETDSSLWRYRMIGGLPGGIPEALTEGAAWRARQSRTNGGVEAHAAGPGFRLMVSEEMREADGGASALLVTEAGEQRLSLRLGGVFVPTDLVLLDASAHRFLLLQRNYAKGRGTWTRTARFALARGGDGHWSVGPVETLATSGPPFTSDNMEGLAIRREGRRTMLYMISDDNFSKTQRTLLMKWELVG